MSMNMNGLRNNQRVCCFRFSRHFGFAKYFADRKKPVAFNAMSSSINKIAPYDALGSIAMTLITIYRRRKKMVKYFAAIEMAL